MTFLSNNTFHPTMEQPGKLFNRRLHLDSFLQEQQRQRQSVVHDSLMIPPPPPMNSAIIKTGTSTEPQGGSPVCVKDTKHFEPLHYETCDDNGGVAIDFCIPDDYSQDVTKSSSSSSVSLPTTANKPRLRRRSPTFLPPILEEHKVTFAAKHVVLKVQDVDSCAVDQRFVHQVFDAVQVWFIPNHMDLTPEEKSNLWYTSEEMATMKEAALEAKLSKRREQEAANSAKVFDAELDKCSLFPNTKPANPERVPSSSSRRARYERLLDAVLLEQYEQRLVCLRLYGRVDLGYSGILDLERLADVCAVAGDTKASHERAVSKALEEQLDEEEEDDTSTTTNSNTPAAATVSGPVLKRSHSFQSKMVSYETSSILDKSVTHLFRTLLAPFLELRSGDLFLGIGEEMSI